MSSFIDSVSLFWLAQAGGPEGTGLWGFLATGGYVMLLIVLCSFATITVIILAALRLHEPRVLPPKVVDLMQSVSRHAEEGDIRPLQESISQSDTPLARIGTIAISGNYASREECATAVATKAREEVHRMEQGLPLLEVMVTVAPLLGLMGTTVALVGMFSAFGGEGTAGPDTLEIAHEIGVALKCTIAGLFVAVPSVMAHTYFARRLDTLAVKIEGLTSAAIHDFFAHFEVKHEPEELFENA